MKYVAYNDALSRYVCATFPAEDDFLRALKTEATEAGLPPIHIAPEQAAFLQTLLCATGARRVLEIGTLAGYSAICMARALPPQGAYLLTLERSPAHAAFAQRKAAEAGLDDVIDVREGDAKQTLAEIAANAKQGFEPFDFVFIDADKRGYGAYLELALPLLRAGGLVCADNTLSWGAVADPATTDKTAQAIRRFNAAVQAHPHLRAASLAPIAGGMTFAVKCADED